MSELWDLIKGAGRNVASDIGSAFSKPSTWLHLGGLGVGAYNAKRQNDYNQGMQLRDMQGQLDRNQQMLDAHAASQAALQRGYDNQLKSWQDYYGGYQNALGGFSPAAKQEGLDDAIARRTGSITRSVNEGYEGPTSDVKGRVSAAYEGGRERESSSALADVLNEAGYRGTMGGYEDDARREGQMIGDMSFDASLARQRASDIGNLAQIEARNAAYVPPEVIEYNPEYDGGNLTALAALLGLGGNLLDRPAAAPRLTYNIDPVGVDLAGGGLKINPPYSRDYAQSVFPLPLPDYTPGPTPYDPMPYLNDPNKWSLENLMRAVQ